MKRLHPGGSAPLFRQFCIASTVVVLGFTLLMEAARAQKLAQVSDDSPSRTLYSLRASAGLVPALQRTVSVDLEQVPLERALVEIARQGGLGVSYSPDLLPEQRLVTIQVERGSVAEALYGLLEKTDLTVLISPEGAIVLTRHRAGPGSGVRVLAPVQVEVDVTADPVARQTHHQLVLEEAELQTGTIAGTVTDSTTGESLPGVNVVIAGTQQGAATDALGRFVISDLEAGTYDLLASFVGYTTKRVEGINVTADDTTVVNIGLVGTQLGLEEVVVIGYGEQQRADVTGSISSVNGEDLTAVPTSNIAEALQGQAPGVLITQSSGEPGAGMDVMIRGVSTLGDSDPLYVVDGVPIDGGLTSLSTANIESVEILKDAAATAIYGSRAANGVVLITTKQGSPGEIQVQFSARTGVSRIPESRRIDMMNTQQFHEFSVDAYQNAGLPVPTAWEEPHLSQNLKQNTDWQEALFRPGLLQNYNITVSGGNEDAVYSFSTGYLDEKGTVVSDGFNRATFRVNSRFYIGENERLTIGENIGLSRSASTGDIVADDFKETYQQSPTVPLHCPDNLGGFCGPTIENSPGFRLNRVGLLQLDEYEGVTQRLIGTAYAEYDILPGLSYRINLSADISVGETEYFSPLYDLDSNVNTERDLDQSRTESRALIVENFLTYNAYFAQVHNFEALAGFAQEKRNFESISAQANGFPSGDLRTINAATGQTVVSGGATASALRSVFGRVQYGYDDRYRAQFAIRWDGSSRFGSESRWGMFPSGSVSWSLHNESFMRAYDDLSRLTLRASWGVTGTQQIPDFAAIPTVQPIASYVFGRSPRKVSGSAILEVGNSELQWQETKQLDIGLNVGLFNDRLTFILDYFRKNTSNLLLQIPVATTSGIWRDNGAYQNVGVVQNSGFELGTSYQQSLGDFSLQVSGNIATIQNEVHSLGVEEIVVTVSDELGEGQTITQPGSEIGAFYGYISDGPFRDQADVDNYAEQPGAAPGDMKFRDLNGDGVINSDDRTIIGSPFPNFFYGLNMRLGYKNLWLRVQMDGVQGRDIFALRADNDVKGFNNTTADYLDRWTPDNINGTHPRAHTTDPNRNLRSSTYRVQDGSYLAIRNVTLGYDVDPDMISHWFDIRNLRLFVSASNLAWITSYDGYNPEIGADDGTQASLTRSMDTGSYPIARSLEVGVSIGF